MHRAWLFFGCLGCWTSPAPSQPSARGAPAGTCTIRDTDLTPVHAVTLSLEGLAFAEPRSPFKRFEAVVRGSRGKATLENATFVLEGELDLGVLPLRPREVELREGWLELREAVASEAEGDALRLEAALPAGIAPTTASFTLPCKTLTFAAPPEPSEDSPELTLVELAIGTELRARPEGPMIGRVTGTVPSEQPDQPAPLEAYVLEKRGAMTRVRIPGTNPVSAWASTRAVREPDPYGYGGLGGFGYRGSGSNRTSTTCTRELPIYVKLRGRKTRVGHVKVDAEFFLTSNPPEEREIGIELGLGKPALRPFVEPVDLEASCH